MQNGPHKPSDKRHVLLECPALAGLQPKLPLSIQNPQARKAYVGLGPAIGQRGYRCLP